jgi:hypothetical protein
MRNSDTPQRRGSSNSEQPEGFYLRYLRRLADRHAEQAADLEIEEKYWRERERLNLERQQFRRAA